MTPAAPSTIEAASAAWTAIWLVNGRAAREAGATRLVTCPAPRSGTGFWARCRRCPIAGTLHLTID